MIVRTMKDLREWVAANQHLPDEALIGIHPDDGDNLCPGCQQNPCTGQYGLCSTPDWE